MSDQDNSLLNPLAAVGQGKTLDLVDARVTGIDVSALLNSVLLRIALPQDAPDPETDPDPAAIPPNPAGAAAVPDQNPPSAPAPLPSLPPPLAAAALMLTSLVIVSQDAASLHFTGLATGLVSPEGAVVKGCLFDLPATADRGAERHLVFTVDLPATLRPSQFLGAYSRFAEDVEPFLAGGGDSPFLQSMGFEGGQLLFSSLDYDSDRYAEVKPPAEAAGFAHISAGVQFKASFELADEVAASFKALSLNGPFHYVAGIVWDGVQPRLRLAGSPAVKFSLASFSFGLSYLSLDFSLASLGRTYPRVSLHGNLAIGATVAQITADFEAVSKKFRVSLTEPLVLPTLDDLSTLMGLKNVMAQYLPASGSSYGAVTLQSMWLSAFVSSPVYFEEAGFAFSTEHPVSLIDGVVSVTPFLNITIASPFDAPNRSEEVMLCGEWMLGETSFNTILSLEDQTLQAEMTVGQSLDLSELSSKIIPGVRLPADSIVLMDMELSADWKNKSFEAVIDVATDWLFQIAGTDFTVYDLEMEVSFGNGEVSDCALSGRLGIAGLDLDALARYEDGGGWTLRCMTLPDNVISLTGIVAALAADLNGIGANLGDVPDSFSAMDVSIKDLFLEHRTGDGSTTFYCSLNHALSITSGFSIDTVFVEIEAARTGLTGTGRAMLTIAGTDIFISAAKLNAGWMFSGGTADNQAVAAGALIEDLAAKFGVGADVPDFLKSVTFKSIAVTYNTANKDFAFSATCDFALDGHAVDLQVSIAMTYGPAGYARTIGGQITIGDRPFDVKYWTDSTASGFVADYHKPGGDEIGLRDLVKSISPSLAAQVPAGLSLTIESAMFGYRKDGQAGYVLAVHLGASANLSNIPLVGHEFPSDQTIGVNDLQVLAVSRALDQDAVSAFNAQLGTGIPPLPAGPLNSGVNITASLALGNLVQKLSLPLAPGVPAAQPAAGAAAALPVPAAAPAAGGKWFDVQKSFGPVSFERIGVDYKDGTLWFMMDASLSVAALTIGLDGLAAGSPLKPFEPKFKLGGLSIACASGPVVISGGFLSTQPDDASSAQYMGQATIQTPGFGISAMGSYGTTAGKPSMFIFALLSDPIGGPPFFFVTGLAAGFGYNSRLRRPDISEVPRFSLVRGVLPDPSSPNPFSAKAPPSFNLAAMAQDVTPAVGEMWFAAGVRFTSFEMIQSFALLIARLGSQFQLGLLGLSRVSIPVGASEPVAYAEIALEAEYNPQAGLLSIDGVLTSASYVFSRDCHLTGGFAFYTWMTGEHAGEFVLTLGGYHPQFDRIRPYYYPVVPRLGMNWQVNSHVSVKGGEYFALIPSGLMAGVSMQAVWQSGDLRAWFDFEANFWIQWKPFHYTADMHIHLGASYVLDLWLTSVTITVHVGADLAIWGPSFAGTADIDLSVVSFSVSFGNSNPATTPIDWATFKSSLLPKEGAGALPATAPGTTPTKTLCKARVVGGLIKDLNGDGGFDWVIDPERFEVETSVIFPSLTASYNGHALVAPAFAFAGGAGPRLDFDRSLYPAGWNLAVGLSPMGIERGDAFTLEHAVTIMRRDASGGYGEALDNVVLEPQLRSLPKALWGDQGTASGGGADRLVADAMVGFRIKPQARDPQVLRDVDLGPLLYEHNDERRFAATVPAAPATDACAAVAAGNTLSFNLGGLTRPFTNSNYVLSALTAGDAPANRARLLHALVGSGLEIDPDVDLAQAATDILQDWPEIALLGEEK